MPIGPKFGAIGRLGSLLGRILQPQLDGIHADLAGDFVDHALDGELGNRSAGRAVGRHFRAVGDHVVTHNLHVFDIIGSVGAHGARLHRRPGEGAGLIFELGLGGYNTAVLLGADLDAHVRSRGRPRGFEDLLPRHHHLDGATCLFGER